MVLAILQARMSSRRYPGKVMAPLLGEPMILHQLRRIQRAKEIDQIIVATSDKPSDDVLADFCQKSQITLFRGSLHDVLDRFYKAALFHNGKTIIRLTADCPLIEPQIIDAVTVHHKTNEYDYTSNIQKRSFPDGLDVEVFDFRALKKAWNEAFAPQDREHVTPYLRRGNFRTGHYVEKPDLSKHRWTVDYPGDLNFVRMIYEALYPTQPAFTMTDVLSFIEKNDCARMQHSSSPHNPP